MSSDEQPPSDQPNPNIRVSNAEREEIIAILHRNTEEGRLDLTEFNERAQAVYEAKTFGEMQALIDDLPEGITHPAAVSPAGKKSNLTPGSAAPLTLSPKASSVHKKGKWQVPRDIIVKSAMSEVTLDFSKAVITTREVNISVHDKGSELYIILPKEDAYAVDDVKLKMASLNNDCDAPVPGGVRFNVTGKIFMSAVYISRKSQSSWWDW